MDTNIILRHLVGDHTEHSPRATAYLRRIENGDVEVRTADTVVFETVFTLERFYKQPKGKIRDAVLPLLELPALILPGKRRYRRVFDLYVEHSLSFADAYHAVLAENSTDGEIVSFDRGFDRVSSIKRTEPA